MYDTAKKSRAANKAKAERLANRPIERVDSSDWTPPPLLNADVKTGMRPVSKQALKRGGKVHGDKTKARADRVARKAGGRVETKGEQPLVDRYVNRDLKKANEYRDGKKHDGGLKKGGRVHKDDGGPTGWGTGKAGKREKQFQEWMKNEDVKNPSEMGIGERIAKGAKVAGKALIEPFGTQTARIADSLGMKKGGRAKKANGGPAKYGSMEEMIRRNPAPEKKSEFKMPNPVPVPPSRQEEAPKFKKDTDLNTQSYKKGGSAKLAKGTKNARAKHAAGGKVHSDVAEDKKLVKSMVKSSALRDAKCGGGRMKKEGGGAAGPDPRLALVSPKALNFAQNMVTPGLKKGGRAKKADGGGLARAAGVAAAPALAPIAMAADRPPVNIPPVSSGLMPQPNVMANSGPVFDPEKYGKSSSSSDKQIRNRFGFMDALASSMSGGPSIGQYYGSKLGRPYGDSEPSGSGMPNLPTGGGGTTGGTGLNRYNIYGGGQTAKDGGRIGRASGGRAKNKGKGKTNINIVIAQSPKQPTDQASAGAPPMPPMPPKGMPVAVPPPAAGGMPPMGGGMPPMPPAGAGAPPAMPQMPPMARKAGGRVKKFGGGALGGMGARGAIPSMAGGMNPGGQQMPAQAMQNAQGAPFTQQPIAQPFSESSLPVNVNPALNPGGQQMPMQAMQHAQGMPFQGGSFAPPGLANRPSMPVARKAGGRITKVAHSYKDMEAGAGSGEGRLQKTDIAKRMPRKAGGKVYRSYKDMDAGAGSGFGRLEKTEIESKKSRKG